ncbi:putative HNHc nuclease [Lacticaseibacillus saniviri]
MIWHGRLGQIKGNQVTITLDDDTDVNVLRLAQLSNGKQPSVSVDVEDGRRISPDQRKKIWALLNDFADYTGYDPLDMEMWTKAYYMAETGSDYFSMSTMSMEQASHYLSYVIDFGFAHDIPWKKKNLDAIPSDYPLMMQCLKHKMCIICGKHAEIDHEPPIGAGRNRNDIDNRKYKLMPLCTTHHRIRHGKGIDWFMDFYHIKPVKLDEPTLISLKLNTRAQFQRFDGGGAND